MAALVIPAARPRGDAFPMPRRQRRRAARFTLAHRARIEAVIDRLVALSQLTGMSLARFGAAFFDRDLGVPALRGRA